MTLEQYRLLAELAEVSPTIADWALTRFNCGHTLAEVKDGLARGLQKANAIRPISKSFRASVEAGS